MDRQVDLTAGARLSPRMRECLRLVHQRKSTKKIAQLLKGPNGKPLQPGTIDNYIAQAVQLLGAADRFEAAEVLFGDEGHPPSNSGVQLSGVDQARPGEGETAPGRQPWWRALPIRMNGAAGNDLTILERLFGILAIAIGMAIAFGSIASGLRVFSDLISSFGSS